MAQAAHINSLVAAVLAEDAAARILVVGDFNDFDQSPPLLAMTTGEGQLSNALAQVPAGGRYSFVFGGASQLIDGILLSPAALADLVAVDILHVNADYPAGWTSDLSTPYRSSDHDVPLVVLQLPRPDAPTPTPPPSPTPLPVPETDEVPAGNRWLLPIAGSSLALLAVAAVWWWRRR
jgi:predicted extracellular nuclease